MLGVYHDDKLFVSSQVNSQGMILEVAAHTKQ